MKALGAILIENDKGLTSRNFKYFLLSLKVKKKRQTGAKHLGNTIISLEQTTWGWIFDVGLNQLLPRCIG